MLYAMFGGQNGILNLVSGFVGSLVLTRALDRHNQKKYPWFNRKKDELDQDERIVQIKGKAASATINLIYILLFIGMVTGVVIDNPQIRFACTSIGMFIYVTNLVIFKLLSRKM
jgi:uncharacterized membrane protein